MFKLGMALPSSRKIKSPSVRCFDCGLPLFNDPAGRVNTINYEIRVLLVLGDYDEGATASIELRAGMTRAAAVDYFLTESCWSEQAGEFADGKGTPAERLAYLRGLFIEGGLEVENQNPPDDPESFDLAAAGSTDWTHTYVSQWAKDLHNREMVVCMTWHETSSRLYDPANPWMYVVVDDRGKDVGEGLAPTLAAAMTEAETLAVTSMVSAGSA